MAVKEEIVALERRFWQSMIDKDVDAAVALIADTSVVTGAQGVATIGPEAFAKMMAGGNWTLKSYAFKDVQFSAPSADVAILAYKVEEELIVEGKPLSLAAADASVWVRHRQGWLCVLHTESVLGDPFGRDQRAA